MDVVLIYELHLMSMEIHVKSKLLFGLSCSNS